MYEQTNTMMETKTLFQIPQLLDGDAFTSEDLRTIWRACA